MHEPPVAKSARELRGVALDGLLTRPLHTYEVIHVAVVGQRQSGKTCVCERFGSNLFVTEFDPTSASLRAEGEMRVPYSQLRPPSYAAPQPEIRSGQRHRWRRRTLRGGRVRSRLEGHSSSVV